jgi:hypothetical protein
MSHDHLAQITETAIAELLALSALKRGTATDSDMNRLRFMVMMAHELASDGIGPEVFPLCAQAIALGLSDYALLRELASLHDQQREAATARQYIQAMFRI